MTDSAGFTDEIGRILGEIRDERALPEGVRARVTASLVERHWASEEATNPVGIVISGDLAVPAGLDLPRDIDVPRALPAAARARLHGALADEGAGADWAARARGVAVLADVDGPRALGDGARARLEAVLVNAAAGGADSPPAAPVRRRFFGGAHGRAARALAVAASLTLIAATTVAVVRTQGPVHNGQAGLAAPPGLLGPTPSVPTSPLTLAPFPSVPLSGPAGADYAGSVLLGVPLAPPPTTPPPPFTSAPQPAVPAERGSGAKPPVRAAYLPALRVGIVGGDAAQETGFRAYIDVLNRSGGAGGHPIAVQTVSPGHAGAGTIATINLAIDPLSTTGTMPDWVSAPTFETLSAPEGALKGPVFDFASPAERQAHLMVAEMFPAAQNSARAVIYEAAAGIFSDRVPAAFDEALRGRGITPVHLTYRPGTAVFLPADAVFLSLPADMMRTWLQERPATYVTGAQIGGIYSLYDEAALRWMPDGMRLIAPFAAPSGDEAASLRAGAARALTAGVLHGWLTAKGLAFAIWASGATSAPALQNAMNTLRPFDQEMTPPYEVRPGTHVRTPEGLLVTVRAGHYHAASGFRRDP